MKKVRQVELMKKLPLAIMKKLPLVAMKEFIKVMKKLISFMEL